MSNTIKIQEPKYFSYLDEKSFFLWLESIEGVVAVKGGAKGLEVTLAKPKVDRACVSDLIAIFCRYSIGVCHLSDVVDESDGSWFSDPEAYWNLQK